jgi:FtsP/CotA-like multicopper oxidase with cupredoxin domain
MLTRRNFLASALAASSVSFAAAESPRPAPTVLRLVRRSIEVNGKAAEVFGISQPDGFLGLDAETGGVFRVRLENHLDSPSLIHWHGLTPPWQQDGVPGISGPPVTAGGTADYDFPLPFGGTYWMHSHYGLQEQLLMAAPLIIRDPTSNREGQEVVVILNDFSFMPPEEIFAKLRKISAPVAPMRLMGMPSTMAEGPGDIAGPGMAMPSGGKKPDLNDVQYDAFLANSRTLADPEVIKVEAGGRVLLRIINGSSMSAYHIDLGRLKGELNAVDGHGVVPVEGHRFPAASAQRLDIKLTLPAREGAYPILAVLEGERKQTGVILVAGRAKVARIPQLAKTPSPPVTLALESRLRATEPLKLRAVDRTHVLNLTGDMQTYQWSINNVAWTQDTPPFPVKRGERVELIFVNQTIMPHPMHLHGHVFQVTAINGDRFDGAMRDTVLVPPKTSVAVAFDTDNPGWWALHCHLLYHFEAGMFATIRYL